ncbi:MAG: ACT domain-containing protein [Gemmatimonadaceae bacterium]
MHCTITAALHDRPGVLNRAVALFHSRGVAIDALSVRAAERAGELRMSVVVRSDAVDALTRILTRAPDVISVEVPTVAELSPAPASRAPSRTAAMAETSGAYPSRWQADGFVDEDAA